ncbi:hypothetical protein PAT3040_00004 [Paenibacillus agaridevorans]|uniref:WYL domain-containing protein n=1 Tax=Paenibacillus agaridevorans TaxID=171404 RepID=A0A2R5EQ53_9BACL|nr:hypothetical protein [Paenibacillus agaridevorans]GBG05524.1 hypothetical protein PAT3040_00004 [Paenibacillus agaridevorans]
MEKYIGKVVQLIYIDRHRNVTIRDVKVLAVKDDRVKAHCFSAGSIRIFDVSNIVDVEQVNRHAS